MYTTEKELIDALLQYQAILNGEGSGVLYVKYIKQNFGNFHDVLHNFLKGFCLQEQMETLEKLYNNLKRKDQFLCFEFGDYIKLYTVDIKKIKLHIQEWEEDHGNDNRKYYRTFEIKNIFNR